MQGLATIGFISLACCCSFLASAEASIQDEKRLSANWETPLYLLFCRRGNRTAAHLVFEPPPATPTVRLISLEVLIWSPGRLESRFMINTVELNPISNSSGLVHYEVSSISYSCASDCKGYYAKIFGGAFSDDFTCLRCKTSRTEDGCLYYPNGAARQIPGGSVINPGGNCTIPEELKEQLNCASDRPNQWQTSPDPRQTIGMTTAQWQTRRRPAGMSAKFHSVMVKVVIVAAVGAAAAVFIASTLVCRSRCKDPSVRSDQSEQLMRDSRAAVMTA